MTLTQYKASLQEAKLIFLFSLRINKMFSHRDFCIHCLVCLRERFNYYSVCVHLVVLNILYV
jgi:hypothetical protein